MEDKPEQQLTEKIKDCQKPARQLREEYESPLLKQKSTQTTGDSDHPVETPLVDEVTKRFMDVELAAGSSLTSTDTAGSSEHSVKPSPLVDDVTKQLKDIDLALESNQQQAKLALQQYLHTQPALPTPADRPMIQSEDNQKQIAKVDNGQNEAKLNPPVQALFTGTLPDDVYLHLMSVTGIQECLMSNRLVCSFWNVLVLERCKSQMSLKLFENFEQLMVFGEDVFHFDKMNDASLILKSIADHLLFEGLEIDHQQLVNSSNTEIILTRENKLEASKFLTDLFPKVEELVLYTEFQTLISIEHLFQFYAKQLTSLTMNNFGKFEDIPKDKFQAFSFPVLKTLNVWNFSPKEDQLLSLLPQLESLSLTGTEISLETLLRTGTQLEDLSINDIEHVYTSPEDKFSKRLPISNKIRKFALQLAENELQVLEFISVNLTSLQCLKLYFDCERDNIRHLSSVTSYLLPLHQLHSLTLQAPVSFFLLTNNQLAEIQPLPTVRHLKLLLSGYDSLSMDLFSRALFSAFPKVEQILLTFTDLLDTGTLAEFEDFAGKHPNVVQLFRSRDTSKFTALPSIVSPLLGQYRQVYEEYIAEEELFGVPICKLGASLVRQKGEDGPNLKSTLRPADPLAAMSNLTKLLESKAFTFLNFHTKSNLLMAEKMQRHMFKCALKCGPSEGERFMVTCKCVLSLLDCSVLKKHYDNMCTTVNVHYPFARMLEMVEHSQKQQFKEEDLLAQIHNAMDKVIEYALHSPQFDAVIKENLRHQNGVYRVETARALLRVCQRSS